MSNSTIRNAVRFALTAGVAASFVNAPAFAADDDDSTKLDRVEVTGSRIKRTQLEGAMPVTSVTREDIDKTGLASIGDLLQELPAAGAALNTNFNNGGDGSTRVDLRNLGSNRVLVLVNGRRWVNITGGSGSVDLNTIPISIIERVEVLKDGASAVYGSDAIAGVINIITRKDFDGAAANAQIGEYDEGDGRQEYYDFSVGSSGSRSSAFFNASYFNGQPVHAGDRDVSKEPLFGTTNTLGSSTTPYGRFRVSDAAGELGGAFSIFSGAGATRNTSDALNTVPVPGSFFAYNPSFAYNFAPDNYLTTPSERWSIFAQARFDITDNVTFTTDALYNKRISEQLLAAMPVIVGALGNLADGAPIGIDVSNPYNFFGMTLSPTASATNFTDGILRANSIQRRFVETGGRSFNQDVATYRFGGGFEGNFEAVGRVWDWSAHYTFTQTTEMDITYGLLNTARLRTALGPVAACTGACVPLNMFGGVGTITQGMLDWVTFNAHDDLGTTTRDYTGNISGEIFDLPAGPVGIAVGYEYRQEEGFDDPDALIAAGNTTGNARSPTVGSYSLSEFYAEFAIPLLKDAPLAEDLELQLAFRSSDYTTFGSTTNMKLGIRWQPFNDLLVRGTYQEGFRAPSIAELYLGRSDSFPNLTDPCSVAATNGGPGAAGGLDPTPDDAAESQLLANCTNTAVTNGFGSFTPDAGIVAATTNVFVPAAGFVAANMYGQSNTQIRITVGGNPNLSPETATSTTFGFVYSPSYVDGLSLSLDWYKIELEEAIAGVGTATIAAACYVGGQTSFCNLIDRLPTGDIDDFFSGNTNVSTLTAQGVDLNVVYRAGELPLVPGEWKFTWDTAYVQKLEQCDLDPLTLGLTCNNFVQINVGDGSVPRFKSNLDIDWTWGDWEATWRMRFIGRQYEFCSSTAAYFGFPCSNATSSSSGTNAMGATTYHSVQVSYNVSDWDTRFTFGILNVGDKEPPLSAQAFANSFDATTYEVPGMFPYIRISKQF